MLKLSLCDYSEAYIHVKGTTAILNTGTAAAPNNVKKVTVINCASFTDCINEINIMQIMLNTLM